MNMIIFETVRLYIRQYTRDDEEHFFRVNGDAEVMRYIREPKDRSECAVLLARNIALYQRFPLMGRWAMIEKTTGTFVGTFAIIPTERSVTGRDPEIQLGYALLKDYWGRGYASESTLGGLQYAFNIMKLPKIVAITDPLNLASQKVLLRCGFTQLPNIKEGNRELCYFSAGNPNVVETERLHLFPLTPSQLYDYIQGNDLLEEKLCLARTGRIMAPQVKQAVTGYTLPQIQKNAAADYLFYTFWLVVDKASRAIVAELGFKGPPNAAGQVEIGYGTMPAMQGKGYMTEAVKGMLQWAAARPTIKTVLAEVNKANTHSLRVVQKNNFEHYETKGDMLWWRFNVQM